jgi:hypothetical protein
MSIGDHKRVARREDEDSDLLHELVFLLVIDDTEVVGILRMDLHSLHSSGSDGDPRGGRRR